MTRGRKTATRRKIQHNIGIYEDVAARLTLLYYDPLRKQIGYGELSKLINTLLEEYLASLSQPPGDE